MCKMIRLLPDVDYDAPVMTVGQSLIILGVSFVLLLVYMAGIDLLQSFRDSLPGPIFPDSQTISLFECVTHGIYDTFLNSDTHFVASTSTNLSCKYFTESQFNNLSQQADTAAFSIFHPNIRSMSKNYDDLRSTLSHSFTVLGFTETWLNDDICGLFPISPYNPTHLFCGILLKATTKLNYGR